MSIAHSHFIRVAFETEAHDDDSTQTILEENDPQDFKVTAADMQRSIYAVTYSKKVK